VTWANGRAPATSLKLVAKGCTLLSPTALAWRNLVVVHSMMNDVLIKPASEYGAGMRDIPCQQVFWRAGQGDKAAIKQAHLDPDLDVTIAVPGSSSHGWGNRIDMLFDGHSPNAIDLSTAKRYGFTREFGSKDKNHFEHDRVTATAGVRNVDRVKLVAEFLNERHIGRTTNAVHTGDQNDRDFTWLVQHWGHLQKTYPVACREDGKRGPYTDASLHSTWVTLRDAWVKSRGLLRLT
jgi:hypothetical protein